MDDLISRKAVLDALGECPDNWQDSPEEIEAVNSWMSARNAMLSVPSVPAVPLDKLCNTLSGLYEVLSCWECEKVLGEDYCQEKNAAAGQLGIGNRILKRRWRDWMRLIDADALIKDIDGDLLDGIAEARAIEKIENAPTIDAAPVKHGRWVCWFYPGDEHVECSICKTQYYEDDLYIGGNDFPKYCPSCGAKMDLEE